MTETGVAANQSTGTLGADEILAWAEGESGARGLGDEGLLKRFGAMIDWINARGPYQPGEIDGMKRQLQKLLVGRLLIGLDRQRFPGIAAERIEQPVFIIGFARSGTTFLHSLLAEDPAVLALQSWNVLTPSPPPGAGPVASGRMAYAQRAMEAWMDFCPAQRPMHPYIDKGALQLCEDEEVLTLDFRYAYPYYLFRVPTLEGAILSNDQAEAFAFHREVLQHFQWNTGKTQWICKSPAAQHHLDAIFAAYPDARCIWAHRPMTEMFASLVTLSNVLFDTVAGKPKDRRDWARNFALSMKAAFDRLLTSELIDDPRIMHISFRDLSAAPMAMIEKIYGWLGRPVTPDFGARVSAWLADPDNRVDRYGRYPYSYEALGVEEAWIAEMFADYGKRFGVE
ncbi:MAG TPA: sulfotransferase [Novosphingobium sp.]